MSGSVLGMTTDEGFGSAVALDGGTGLLVGAYNKYLPVGGDEVKVDDCSRCGAVYSYKSDSNGSWTLNDLLVASDYSGSDGFGTSLAVQGDMLLVGSPFHGLNNKIGAVYIFKRSGPSWVEADKFWHSKMAGGDEFGTSVALDSSGLLAVGAPGHQSNQGTVCLFKQNGVLTDTLYSESVCLYAGTTDSNRFGEAVGLSGGNWLLVGAPGYEDAFGKRVGAVLEFTFDGHVWSLANTIWDRAGMRPLWACIS